MRNGLWLAAVVVFGAGLGGGVAMAQDQTPHPGDNGNTHSDENRGNTRSDEAHGNTRSDESRGNTRSGEAQTERRPAGTNEHATPSGSARSAHASPRRARPRTASRSHRFMSQGRYRASIRAPAFQYPAGYSYQRWTDGGMLPRVFLDRTYYYDDYAALGLTAPPNGYQWIRYGTDLLLVNLATGRIADVVDNVFY